MILVMEAVPGGRLLRTGVVLLVVAMTLLPFCGGETASNHDGVGGADGGNSMDFCVVLDASDGGFRDPATGACYSCQPLPADAAADGCTWANAPTVYPPGCVAVLPNGSDQVPDRYALCTCDSPTYGSGWGCAM